MRQMIPRRPSAAVVISMIALFVALSGTGYAALTITGKNVKNGSLTGSDVKKDSLGGANIKESTLRLPRPQAGPAGPRGPQGPPGATGANGAPGSALAFTHFSRDGTVNQAQSKLITQANVVRRTFGTYCITGLPFASNVVANPDRLGSAVSAVVTLPTPEGSTTGCPTGSIAIETYSRTADTGPVDNGVFVQIN